MLNIIPNNVYPGTGTLPNGPNGGVPLNRVWFIRIWNLKQGMQFQAKGCWVNIGSSMWSTCVVNMPLVPPPPSQVMVNIEVCIIFCHLAVLLRSHDLICSLSDKLLKPALADVSRLCQGILGNV